MTTALGIDIGTSKIALVALDARTREVRARASKATLADVEASRGYSEQDAGRIFAALDAGFGAEQRRPMVILDLGGTRLALAVDELVTFAGTLVEALPGPGHLYFAGLGRTPSGDLLWCLDVGQIARNWNALMVPEEP